MVREAGPQRPSSVPHGSIPHGSVSRGDGTVDANSAQPDPPDAGANVAESEAWTLNVSRGGCRLVVEDSVTVGADYHVRIGDGPFRPARVVWVRDEADGQIAGFQFLDVEGAEVPTSSFPPTL